MGARRGRTAQRHHITAGEQLTGSDTNSTLQQLVGALDGAFGGSGTGR